VAPSILTSSVSRDKRLPSLTGTVNTGMSTRAGLCAGAERKIPDSELLTVSLLASENTEASRP
jgi:hypothetical protein